jgi:hypothetical protein
VPSARSVARLRLVDPGGSQEIPPRPVALALFFEALLHESNILQHYKEMKSTEVLMLLYRNFFPNASHKIGDFACNLFNKEALDSTLLSSAIIDAGDAGLGQGLECNFDLVPVHTISESRN